MIYLDTSAALAHLFAEERFPRDALWENELVSSRLLEYEIWNRVHARQLGSTHADAVRGLIQEVSLVELSTDVLSRALEPFPMAVRTLDAIHLSTIEYLRRRGHTIELACYDDRLNEAARAIGIELFSL